MDDTLISSMTSEILSDLRRQQFTDILSNIQDTPASAVLFFDNNGKLLPTDSASTHGAVYQCTQTVQKDQDTLGAPDQNNNQVVNLVQIKLEFQWPANTVHPPNSKVLHASIARY